MARSGRVGAGLLALLIYAAISFLSAQPPSALPAGIPDIIPHTIEYAALAFFLVQAFAAPRRPGSQAAVVLLAAVLAFLDERHQLATPGRIFSWLDLVYDLAGTLAGLAVYRALERVAASGGGGTLRRRWLGRLILHR